MSINFGTNNPKVTLCGYAALTTNSLQFGAARRSVRQGPEDLAGRPARRRGLDLLRRARLLRPVRVRRQAGRWPAAAASTATSMAGLGFDLRLTGPNTFVIDGKVWVTVCGIDVDFRIEHTWGGKRVAPHADRRPGRPCFARRWRLRAASSRSRRTAGRAASASPRRTRTRRRSIRWVACASCSAPCRSASGSRRSARPTWRASPPARSARLRGGRPRFGRPRPARLRARPFLQAVRRREAARDRVRATQGRLRDRRRSADGRRAGRDRRNLRLRDHRDSGAGRPRGDAHRHAVAGAGPGLRRALDGRSLSTHGAPARGIPARGRRPGAGEDRRIPPTSFRPTAGSPRPYGKRPSPRRRRRQRELSRGGTILDSNPVVIDYVAALGR